MKPKNFPERKNQRRISAIDRMVISKKQILKSKEKSNDYILSLRSKADVCIKKTENNLIDNARSIRTKKDRSK